MSDPETEETEEKESTAPGVCEDCGAETDSRDENLCGRCAAYWDHVDAQIDELKERG